MRWVAGTACAAAVAVLAVEIPSAAAPGQPATLAVPLRLSAFAVNMSNIATGTTAVMDIRITRWATEGQRDELIATAVEKGQDALLRALQRMPKHGRISIPGWRGPDPHNVRLGWDLRYAANAPLEDGGQRISIATDRYIGLWEAREQPRTTDYPFSLIEIRLDRAGRGTGKMAVATKIEFDKKKKQMILENYGTEPVRLNEVKIER